MRGAIPPLPQYVFMVRSLVKHRGNFTYTFITIPYLWIQRQNKIFLNLWRYTFRWCLTERYATGSGGITPRILDLAIRWGERSVSRSGRHTHRERAPGTYWIGDLVGPRAGLNPGLWNVGILPQYYTASQPSRPRLQYQHFPYNRRKNLLKKTTLRKYYWDTFPLQSQVE